jgi:hypothetical protein
MTELIDPCLDFPQGPPNRQIPNWSETYVWTGYNIAQDLFFYIHIGRWPQHPDFWEGVLNIVLPGGDVLAIKTFARSERDQGPDVQGLRADCQIPMRRWRLHYDGVCHRMTSEQNRTTMLRPDLPIEPVSLDLVWEATGQVWTMAHDQPWSDGRHYEQHGRIRGVITANGSEIVVDGYGHRDHSLGPRDTSSFNGHTWLAAHFPESDRSLIVMDIRDRTHLQRGMLSLGDQMCDATIVETGSWLDGDLFEPERFTVAVSGSLGEVKCEARRVLDFWWTVTSPAGMHPGLDVHTYRDGTALPFLETFLVFDCAGETGYGFAEISRRFR